MLPKISVMALNDSISVISFAFEEKYDSTAWVSASIPVYAVIFFGIEYVSSGSMTAIDGTMESPRRLVFFCFSVYVRTAFLVDSEPVPAVVGMAIKKPVSRLTGMFESK